MPVTYPRVINKTERHFSNEELPLLNEGLKYNLNTKKNEWVSKLALEAETAISHLPGTDHEYYRRQVANHRVNKQLLNHKATS